MSNKTFAYGIGERALLAYTKTERGTKKKATMAGADSIGYISSINNMYIPTHHKVSGRWEVL